MNEQEKVNELMKPRYKLAADYPGCSFEVGTILEPNHEGELYSKTAGYSWTVTRILEKDVKKFSHLLRTLKWWEHREISEMPEYIKWVTASPEKGMIEKVISWGMHGIIPYANVQSQVNSIRAEYFEPATATDYQAFITKPVNQD